MTTCATGRPGASRRRGFTVTELMVVMVIMTLLASLAVPSFVGSLREERLRTGGRIVVSLVQLARSRAIGEAVYTRVDFDRERNTITLSRLADPRATRAEWVEMNDTLGRPRTMPTGISIRYVGTEQATGMRQALDAIECRPDGSADAAYIVLQGYENELLVIAVDPMRLRPRVLDTSEVRRLGLERMSG